MSKDTEIWNGLRWYSVYAIKVPEDERQRKTKR